MVDYVLSVRKPGEQQLIQGFPTQDNGKECHLVEEAERKNPHNLYPEKVA
jgi:hypothetical protein